MNASTPTSCLKRFATLDYELWMNADADAVKKKGTMKDVVKDNPAQQQQ